MLRRLVAQGKATLNLKDTKLNKKPLVLTAWKIEEPANKEMISLLVKLPLRSFLPEARNPSMVRLGTRI